ncbi:valine--tRNA ligase [Candidatus Heimdallarchaeota archaeon]|nr:MAG: valine--tRNA ligase [Candidatus Heimdallarchaeota archaeon]
MIIEVKANNWVSNHSIFKATSLTLYKKVTSLSDFDPKLTEKTYDPLKQDLILFQKWQDEKLFAFDKTTGKRIFTIDTPPPYANAPWHMGGAIHYSQIDMIARYKRMAGFEVLFPMCLDRNGLPIEVQTEKKFKISMHDVPREEFLAMCKQILDEVGDMILGVCRMLGFSNNSLEWDEIYKTDSEQYRTLTQSTFIKLFKEGQIYEDDRPNNYCTRCKTTIADNEIDYKSGSHTLYDIKFQVKETGEDLIITTSRPELIPAIGVVIFNPKDERYQHLAGKTVITPYFKDEVPIMSHHYAKMEFGTGIMMVCAYGDSSDVQIFRELQLNPKTIIDTNGKITDKVPEFAGLKVKEAKKQIVEKLEQDGYIIEQTDTPHNFPICSRCKTTVEFLAMPEYYLKQVDYLPTLHKYAQEMQFFPPFMKQVWIDWLNTVSIDWPISRRRYYGTEVPIWYCKGCGHPNIPEPGQYYQPWKDDPPFSICQKCGKSDGFEGDLRTFDTWMDSSLSEIYTIMYPHNKKDDELFEKLINRPYICDVRPSAKDIVRTWLHYTMLRGLQLYDKPAFKYAWISGFVVDSKGEKFSKSAGTAIKPENMISKYGGDAVRFYGATEASHGSDIRFNQQRLQGISKFINKLYNIAKFLSRFPIIEDEKHVSLQPADEWILSELAKVVEEAKEGYEIFDFQIPAKILRTFTWDTFASHYVELVKGRAYNRHNTYDDKEQKAAWFTLHKVMKELTKSLAPIIPFVTDLIYRGIYDKTVHLEKYPEGTEIIDKKKYLEITTTLLDLNSAIWKYKKSQQLPLNTPIKKITIPKVLIPLIKDLQSMHAIEKFAENIDTAGDSDLVELNEDTTIYVKL